MKKDIDKIIEDLGNSINEFTDMIDTITKEATGKSLAELIDMPTDTAEGKEAFHKELSKIKDVLDSSSKVCDFEGSSIKITGGKKYTKFEASGCKYDLVHLLAQGVSAMMKNINIKKDKEDEFFKLFIDEVKKINDSGIMI